MSLSQFYYKIMKKLYMCPNVGSSGRDCVLIILFQLYGSKAQLFAGDLCWMGQYEPQSPYWKKKKKNETNINIT